MAGVSGATVTERTDDAGGERRGARGRTGIRARRRPMLIALGVALAVVAGLSSYVVATQTSQLVSVLTTSSDIGRGDRLEASDFAAILISNGQVTNAVPVAQLDALVGQVAAVDLPAGSLVTTENVTAEIAVDPGLHIVGVPLGPTQKPSAPLVAGDAVLVVFTPIAQGEAPVGEPPTMPATVHTVQTEIDGGLTLVDVVVPAGQATTLAAWAATGRVSLVLDPSGAS